MYSNLDNFKTLPNWASNSIQRCTQIVLSPAVQTKSFLNNALVRQKSNPILYGYDSQPLQRETEIEQGNKQATLAFLILFNGLRSVFSSSFLESHTQTRSLSL